MDRVVYCVACGTQLAGPFCYACGKRAVPPAAAILAGRGFAPSAPAPVVAEHAEPALPNFAGLGFEDGTPEPVERALAVLARFERSDARLFVLAAAAGLVTFTFPVIGLMLAGALLIKVARHGHALIEPTLLAPPPDMDSPQANSM